ncbi:Transposon Ty3-I Gag-Pol polyprotein [Abeliophyllum distichum]|uniref:Transposon Ty3-I Gag-Pol polyprotein n=1 Tax=Abeliophyllum distichum TaxID=126358 RepID=A0ABD1TJR5_9LAMI
MARPVEVNERDILIGVSLLGTDLVKIFTLKYFPPARVNRLKHEISNFQKSGLEKFCNELETFKELLQKCPSHSFPLAAQNHYFYSGLAPNSRSSVASVEGGFIQNRSTSDIHELYEMMSEQFILQPDRIAEESNKNVRSRNQLPPIGKN